MEKAKLHSPNLSQANIQKIAELFPNCIVESKQLDGKLSHKVDFDLLRQELSEHIVEGPQERYQLNWPGKREALHTANAPIAKTLRPAREESVDFDNTENLFIEGDNLDALKLLQESYLEKVKMIYIDPPYNTGKDILYKNDYSSTNEDYMNTTNQLSSDGLIATTNIESDGKFHSNWLSMMYERIKLSRTFLREDGIIAIAIDHYEINTLISICDEIFGNLNRLGLISIVHKPEGRNQARFFAPSNEFMLIYAKDIKNCKMRKVVIDEDIAKTFDQSDSKGKFRYNDYTRLGGGDHNLRKNKPHFYYPIYVSKDLKEITLDEKLDYTKVLPITNSGQERTWKTIKESFEEKLKAGQIVAKKDSGNKIKIFEKYRETQIFKTVWQKPKYHAIHHGTNLVSKLLGKSYFDFPKSLFLIKDVIQIFTDSNDLILDFFAGSSTTAHAVMQLNVEDGNKRRFLMIQIPQDCDEKSEAFKAGYKNIAEISKERIRRAGKQIKEANATTATDLDTGFRVLKVDSSNVKDVYYTPDAIDQAELALQVDHIKEDRSAEDLLFQIMLEWGLDLSLPVSIESIESKTVYWVADNGIAACFDNQIEDSFVKTLAERAPLRVVFKDSCFETDATKINVTEIFKHLSPETEIKTI